jgi:hypothetical protein
VKVTAAEAADRIEKLYAGILDPTLTPAAIDAELAILDTLAVGDIVSVADRLGLKATVSKAKTKADRLALLKKHVKDRRGTFERPKY